MTESEDLNDGGTPWRWVVGALLVAGAAAVVAFGISRSRADREHERQETERAELELDRAKRVAQGDVNYVVFCRSAQADRAGLDIQDALDQIALPSFPANVTFTVVVSLTADRPGRRYEIVRFGRDGKVDFAQELKLADGDGIASVNAVQVTDLELLAPGEVVFRVFRDGETVAERVLRVGAAPAAAPGRPGTPAAEAAE
jgi:hypothetical protein